MFLCSRQIQFLQVCQRIFGHYFSSKDSKTISLWVFQFFIRMMFSTCIRLIWQPFLVFSTKNARKRSLKYENNEKFREIGKKTLFSEKNCSGHSRISLDNRDEIFWHKNKKFNPKSHKEEKQIFKKITFPQNVTVDNIGTLLTSLPKFFCKLFFAVKTRNLEICGFFLFLTRKMIF